MGTFELESEEIIDREAKAFGGSAHVTVPKDWRGAKVKVIRVSDPDNPTNE
jgi:putative transposon-encoded protein